MIGMHTPGLERTMQDLSPLSAYDTLTETCKHSASCSFMVRRCSHSTCQGSAEHHNYRLSFRQIRVLTGGPLHAV